MSLPRFIPDPPPADPAENGLVALDAEAARHLRALRLRAGDALEVLLPGGPWKADLAELGRDAAKARLVAPLAEDREAPVPLWACLPLTAHLPLWDDWLPPLVELGITRILPVAYARSEYDAKKTAARRDRWERLLRAACEQSHRGRVPDLAEPLPFAALPGLDVAQKWVAYEVPTGTSNPALRLEPLAFTCGPEGGITDDEFAALSGAGWQPVTLGKSILRAVTCPVALMGAVQFLLGRS